LLFHLTDVNRSDIKNSFLEKKDSFFGVITLTHPYTGDLNVLDGDPRFSGGEEV